MNLLRKIAPKKILIFLVMLIVIVVVATLILYLSLIHRDEYGRFGIDPQKLSEKITDKELGLNNSDLERLRGFIGKDLSSKNMSEVSVECISKISYDINTHWPNNNMLPKGFDGSQWIETGREPGLNVRKIQEKRY